MDLSGIIDTIKTGDTTANLLITSFIGLYGITLFSILFKDIPQKIVSAIVKQVTTTLEIANSEYSFIAFIKYFERIGEVNKLRNIRFINGRWEIVKI
jgi:hypothetical protein